MSLRRSLVPQSSGMEVGEQIPEHGQFSITYKIVYMDSRLELWRYSETTFSITRRLLCKSFPSSIDNPRAIPEQWQSLMKEQEALAHKPTQDLALGLANEV